MNLTTRQKAAIFSLYATNPKQKLWDELENDTVTLCGVSAQEGNFQVEMQSGDVDWWNFSSCKLVLKSLSAITDEDAIEVAKMYSPKSFGHTTRLIGTAENGCVVVDYFDPTADSLYIEFPLENLRFNVAQFLIQKGYAISLFIAPNHPYNGKNCLELGLAIESQSTNQQKQG